jgi:GntR family transcriptional regulator/MocR family aminotransferase
MRQVYAGRRETLQTILAADFARWLDVLPASAGLHLAARVRRPANAEAIAKLAREHGIGLGTLKNFQLGKAQHQALIFGFATIDPAAIRAGLARLRRLLDAHPS